MRSIMVLNAKGGCGKSTIATSLAAYFASQYEGAHVTLADYDPQRSASDWLALRPDDRPTVHGLDAFDDGLKYLERSTDFLIMDAPARIHGGDITQLIKHAQTIIVPVLPSPVDINAVARYVKELQNNTEVQHKRVKIGVVANRVKENTKIYEFTSDFLDRLKVPFITHLREAMNYNRAFGRGLGIHELPPYLAWPDWEQWEPLIKWLESKRSQP
ncbi:MAG TPA: ParA family protein [Gammaproteobacteria bacterium]|nr:ParA family protein [Gammaproteobacteria bacterium]